MQRVLSCAILQKQEGKTRDVPPCNAISRDLCAVQGNVELDPLRGLTTETPDIVILPLLLMHGFGAKKGIPKNFSSQDFGEARVNFLV